MEQRRRAGESSDPGRDATENRVRLGVVSTSQRFRVFPGMVAYLGHIADKLDVLHGSHGRGLFIHHSDHYSRGRFRVRLPGGHRRQVGLSLVGVLGIEKAKLLKGVK